MDSTVAAEDRKYFDRLGQFVRDWQPKSETQRLKEFVEYLDYFEQAGGSINLEQESGDAVQLMTVHAAKGWNSTTSMCFVLCSADFPLGERPRVLEFPRGIDERRAAAGKFSYSGRATPVLCRRDARASNASRSTPLRTSAPSLRRFWTTF